MSANDTTSEARKAAMIENATSDKLDVRQDQHWLEDAATDEDKDVETPPLSPEIESDEIMYRADVGKGVWKPVCRVLSCIHCAGANMADSLCRRGKLAKAPASTSKGRFMALSVLSLAIHRKTQTISGDTTLETAPGKRSTTSV